MDGTEADDLNLGDLSADRLSAELGQVVGDAIAAAAALERSQTRVLRQVAEEEATFAGVALDLAESGTPVIVRTSAGRPHRGRIVAVGRDFLVIRDAEQAPVFVVITAITALRPQPGAPVVDASGSRPAPLDVGLASVLSGLAPERPRVQVMCAGDPEPLAGTLRAAGADVATIHLDGDGRLRAHVRIPNLAEIVLFDR